MSAWIGTIAAAILAVGAACVFAESIEPPAPLEIALREEDYDRAERIARAALAASEHEQGPASRATLQALDALVDALLDGERTQAADLDALIDREVALARELGGENSREHARALMRKANGLALHRDYPAFVGVTQAAAKVVAALPGKTAPELAEAELQAGFSRYYLEREPIEGEKLIRGSLDTLRHSPVQDPRTFAKALRMYARVLLDSARLDEALQAMREYEAYTRDTFGTRSARHSDAMTWLGFTLRESGRYAAGIDALREGADIAAQLRPYRQRLHIDASIALAQNLGIIGDNARAQVEFERALAIEEKHPTANGYLLGLLLSSLGTLHESRGDMRKAETYFARAIPIYERVFGKGSPKTLVVRKSYAETLQGSERLDAAAAIYEEIIAEYEGNPAAIAGTLVLLPYENLATVRLWQHRYGEAETLYRRFLSLLGEGRDFNEIGPRRGLGGLAAALWGLGRHREAFEQVQLAQRSAVRTRRNAIDQLSERQMLAFEQSGRDVAGLAIAIATDSRDAASIERAWQLVLESSGFITRRVSTRIALASTRHSDEALWQAWRAASSALSTARVAAAKVPSAEAMAAVDRAQDELDRVERHLAVGDSRDRRDLTAEQSDFATIASALPDKAAIVRFVEVSDFAPDRYQRGTPPSNARLYALVRSRGTPARAVDLGALEDLIRRADEWHARSSDAHGDPPKTAAAAVALRRRLLDPLQLPADTDTAFMIPSAALTRVNFAALLDEHGRYLVETGPTFHLLNHEREVLLARAGPTNGSMLLAGAGSVGNEPAVPLDAALRRACPDIDIDLLRPLPGAANELSSLHAVAEGHAAGIDVLSGVAATESAVRRAMPGHSIVHLATHAFAFADHCAGDPILRSISLDLPAGNARSTDAAHLAALSALAFLPEPGGRDADDGLLTSEEIATLDLSAAEWVVLSACETALGTIYGDEGVFGLRRAFRLAGARTVVMSLWKVEDDATAELMRELYRARLIDGRDTPASMRSAMRATLDARQRRGESTHPFYWAGFVAAGAWR